MATTRRKAVPKYTPEQLSRYAAENPDAFRNALLSIWGNNPEAAQQALLGRGLLPQATLGGVPSEMIVGGGQQQAAQALEAMDLAQRAELSRQQLAQGLFGQIQDTMRDPFSIVPALQMYGGAGGGTLAPVAALAATGGRGSPSPYGDAARRIFDQLTAFATGQGGSVAPTPGSEPVEAPAASSTNATPLSLIDAIRNDPKALEIVRSRMRARAASPKKRAVNLAKSLQTIKPGSTLLNPIGSFLGY